MSARSERGQAAVMTVAFLVVLLGAAALAIDVGSWYHAKRELQAAADAAALAGAQALPESPADAQALALGYAQKNGVALGASGITFSSDVAPNDTITVHLSGSAPGFFSKLFGIGSVGVGVTAAARSDNVSQALDVAPIAVNWKHPDLQCSPLPCPDPTELDLADLHKAGSGTAAGSFSLIDLNPADNGTVGAGTLGGWITSGFDKYMPLGDYYVVPSAMFNSSWVVNALNVSIGQVLLFPVYDRLTGSGSNAQFHIIAWVGFHVTGFDASGNPGKVYGWFTRRISEGIQVGQGDNVPDYGVRAVQLVN